MSDIYNREQQKLLLLHEIVMVMKEWPLDLDRQPGFKELVLKQKEDLKKNPGHYLADSNNNSGEQVTFTFTFLKSPPFEISKSLQRVLIEELDDDGIIYYYDPFYKPLSAEEASKLKLKKINDDGDNLTINYIERKKSDLLTLPSIEITANREVVLKRYEQLKAKYPDLIPTERELTELGKNMENSKARPLHKMGEDYYHDQTYIHLRPQVKKLCDLLFEHYGIYYSKEQIREAVGKNKKGKLISKRNVYTCCCELRRKLKKHFKKSVIQIGRDKGNYRLFVE
jgi:hypothetical protein